MKRILILAILVLITEQSYQTTPCICEQLLSQLDCTQVEPLNCNWDDVSKTCATATQTIPTTTITPIFKGYCDAFQVLDCPYATGCAWVSNACTHFTGCTPFAKITSEDCQAISNRCITDGLHCVELGDCSTYKKQQSCVKNLSGNWCYWDIFNSVCFDASTCDTLPNFLITDTQCRQKISTCTTKGRGCITSGINCSDQIAEITCIWNGAMTQSCYWNGITCIDRTCDVAATTFKTDSACRSFTIDQTCTTKSGGGCKLRAGCKDAEIQEACVKNSLGGKCFWTGAACVDLSCISAPKTINSNAGCQAFLEVTTNICITNGAGCVDNGACSAALTSVACVKNISGEDCFWSSMDSKCKEKICSNAPSINFTHNICTAFSSTCTVNSGKNGCTDRTCENAPITLTDNSDCENYYPGHNCIAKYVGGCQTNTTCAAITVDIACIVNVIGGSCFWDPNGSGTCKDKICANAPNTLVDHASCQQFLTTCTVQLDGTGCIDKTCENLTTADICRSDLNNKPCIYHRQCYQKQCSRAPTSYTLHSSCNNYLSSCTVNNDGAGCMPIPLLCEALITQASCVKRSVVGTSGVSYANCYWNNNTCTDLPLTCAARSKSLQNCEIAPPSGFTGYPTCIWDPAGTGTCIDKTCATATLTGTTGVLIGAQNINTANCKAYSATCLATIDNTTCYSQTEGCSILTQIQCQDGAKATGDCYWNGIKCVDKICDNLASTLISYSRCNTALKLCTVNVVRAGCMTLTFCTLYTIADQCKINASQKLCFWDTVTLKCVNATCFNADNTENYDTDIECQAYSTVTDICTVSKNGTGGCQPRQACSSYQSDIQCKFNISGALCHWNASTNACIDLACDTVEQTSSFNTHLACNNLDSTNLRCTVRASGTPAAVANGCMARTNCSNYVLQQQCVINGSAAACEWNATTSTCADKSCATAGSSFTTHNACMGYITNKCTVLATVNNQVNTLAGCTPLAACSTYIDKEQCVINNASTAGACGWNGTVCADKTCATAPASTDYDSINKCSTYLSTCTLADSGQGCITIPATCGAYQISAQCTNNSDSTGNACYWDATNGKCITKTCDNAPTTATDAAGCASYLTTCTADSARCKIKICEDFILSTDALCQAASSICTSNGVNCVLRGTCSQALTSFACVTSADGKACQWIAATTTATAYCVNRSCPTATTDYVTNTQCSNYMAGCTITNGGGCIYRSTCAEANVQEACTYDIYLAPCQWDTTENNCRDKVCGDYLEISNWGCQSIAPNCILGLHGYCTIMKNCENITEREACIKGTDGPCLWVEEYVNKNGTVGACFHYTECKSLAWTSNKECNWISPKCTTNGTNCIAITLCSETNTTGGCVNGYDRACIQSVDYLGSTSPPTCKAFHFCENAFYATHSECQKARSTCTTNGTTGCVRLAACSTYNQMGCFINNVGIIQTSGIIMSTGQCTWDPELISCRDENCSDLQGTTHATCQAQLFNCTSNGTGCIDMATCSSYNTDKTCSTALGLDGTCFWQAVTVTVTTAACRLMACSDVTSGTSTAVCQASLSSCVSDGKQCISKFTCSTYTTKTACNSGGTDGICVFASSTSEEENGTCALMTSCSQANNDQFACAAANKKCSYNATTSQCAPHTCTTYLATNGVCSNILNWDETLQDGCTFEIEIQKCLKIDPSSLDSFKCYKESRYTHTWSNSLRCVACAPRTQFYINIPDNFYNMSRPVTFTIRTSGQILVFAIFLLGYFIL